MYGMNYKWPVNHRPADVGESKSGERSEQAVKLQGLFEPETN